MRKPPREQRLEALERDFRPLLISCLERCGNGRWGLFGHNASEELAPYYHWEDAERLLEIAVEIRELRAEFGQPNPLVERFLHYHSLRGANVPGEPKLAGALLEEIQRGEFPEMV